MPVFFVVAAVEVPSQVRIQRKFARDLDVVLRVERDGLAPAVGIVGFTDRSLIHIAQQKTGKSKPGVGTVTSGRLRGIKDEGGHSGIAMRVKLLYPQLAAKSECVS